MDGLRWLLLLFGLLVIAGVYFYSRREKSVPKTQPKPAARVEPRLDSGDAGEELPDDGDLVEPEAFDDSDDEPARPAERVPQKIVTLRLVARDGGSFRGDELVLSLRGIGMRHGKFGIFHRYDGSSEDNTVFSAASLVEPGSFDMTNIKEQELPGISLFLILPDSILKTLFFSSSGEKTCSIYLRCTRCLCHI